MSSTVTYQAHPNLKLSRPRGRGLRFERLVPAAEIRIEAHIHMKTGARMDASDMRYHVGRARKNCSPDAVERFLQMQLALGPTRFAYTDITAITSHFREKLGQGGYGSVYKGVLPAW